MAFALTRFRAYGIEVGEPVIKHFIQRVEMAITALAADVALDLGNNTGTFWTAVGGTEPGITGLQAMKDIQLKAAAFLEVNGTGVNEYLRGAAVAAGVYTLTVVNVRPSIQYNAANGPTAYNIVLEWELKDDQEPIEVLKTA